MTERSSISQLNNFFCGLHIEAESALFDTSQTSIYDPTFCKANEPGTLRLIRTASKAFSCGGDEKSGAHGPFTTYIKSFLKANGLLSIPVERYRGNRFNILFQNAAGIYSLLPKMKEFLKGGDTNRLLKSAKFDIEKNPYVAGCTALGLIAYNLTIPLWCFVEDKEIHILDSCVYIEEIIEYLRVFYRGH